MLEQSGKTVKISIITTVRNAVGTIGICLASVARQKRVSPAGRLFEVEHVVVDGASTDGTLEKVQAFPAPVYLDSKPDRGIYDGMNRGVHLASGEVVGFLNADDFYWSPDALGMVVDGLEAAGVDAVYGNVAYVRSDAPERVLRVWRSGRYRCSAWRRGWMPPHPALFVRRALFDRHGGFRLDLGSAADYELMVRFLVRERLRTVYVPNLWVAMRAGGASNTSLRGRLRANRMDRRAWTVNGLRPSPWFRFLKPARKLSQYARIGARDLEQRLDSFLSEYEKMVAAKLT